MANAGLVLGLCAELQPREIQNYCEPLTTIAELLICSERDASPSNGVAMYCVINSKGGARVRVVPPCRAKEGEGF